MDFGERSHSTGEAHAVASTSVHKGIQEGAQESLHDGSSHHFADRKLRPGGGLRWGQRSTGLRPLRLWQSSHLSPVPTPAQGSLIPVFFIASVTGVVDVGKLR